MRGRRRKTDLRGIYRRPAAQLKGGLRAGPWPGREEMRKEGRREGMNTQHNMAEMAALGLLPVSYTHLRAHET